MQQNGVPQTGLHAGICGDDAQESGHVGMNHAAALGNAPYPHLLPLNVNLQPRMMLCALLHSSMVEQDSDGPAVVTQAEDSCADMAI